MRLYGRTNMALTDALAHSNNYYFANLGIKLGYDRVSYYAHLFGYGEKAGLDIPGEKPGYFPPAPPKNGGMGMLTSFGEEISQTPLQLAALMSAVANGGTLYYLQYPRSQEEVRSLRSARQARARYRRPDSGNQARHARRRGIWHRPPRPPGRDHHGEDRHLQRRPHAPRLVRFLQ